RVTFGLYRNLDKNGTLALYLEDDLELTTKLWTDPRTTIGRTWTPITVSIGRRRSGFRLVFISTHTGSPTSSDISIDNFKFVECNAQSIGHCEGFTDPFNCSNGNCIHQDNLCDYSDDCGDNTDENSCEKYVQMCNFENNAEPICSWSHDDDADFRWQRMRGDQVNNFDWYDDFWQLYGPDRDHTLGTSKGHFLFLEASAPRQPNDTARVVSPVFAPTTSGECQFRFWYHMYGYDVGALNIYTRTFIGGPLTLVWNQNRERGDEWLRAKIVLKVQEPFQVLIEGVRGSGYEGDIGVDDTTFTPGCQLQIIATLPPFVYSTTQSPYCNATHSHCTQNTRQCIPKDQFCNFNIECTDQTDELSCPLACNFDQNTTCLWTNDRKQKLIWEFGSGRTASSGTGPSTDHSTGSVTGTYIYLETSTGNFGDRAHLISPLYRKSSKTCKFTFWYHMFGDTINTLNIHIRSGGIDTLIWSLQGNQGDQWRQGTAYLPTCASEFNVIVEGIRGTSFTGDIALDDFRFEQCYEEPPLPTCAQAVGDPNQFMCQSKHCILQANKCDYELDCCDGSDEDNNICYEYQRCDFETDSCSWEPSSGSEIEWERYRVNAMPYSRRPPYDHTTRSQLGHYLQLRLNSTTQRDTLATVSNYLGVAAQQGCIMRFWIYFKSSNNGQLVVGYRYAIGDEIIPLPFSNYQSCQTNATQCSWQRIDVSLNAILTQPTEIIIGARTGADRGGIMAIDDITYTPQCVQYNETMSTPSTTTPYTGSSTTTTATTSYTDPSTTTTTATTSYTDPSTTITTSTTTYTDSSTTTSYTGPSTTTSYTGPSTTTPYTNPSTTSTTATTSYTDPSTTTTTTTTSYTDPSTTTTTATTSYTGPPITTSTATPYTGSPTTTSTPTTTTRTTITASIETLATTSTAEITTTTYAQCAQYACYNNGICKPPSTQIGKPICECKPDFNGPQCENEETSPETNNLGAILGGVFGGLGAIASVVVGYIYVSSKKRAARVANASAQLTDSSLNDSTKNATYNETGVTAT
ncbi:unnamed protein product, partial [Rotaria sordida]